MIILIYRYTGWKRYLGTTTKRCNSSHSDVVAITKGTGIERHSFVYTARRCLNGGEDRRFFLMTLKQYQTREIEKYKQRGASFYDNATGRSVLTATGGGCSHVFLVFLFPYSSPIENASIIFSFTVCLPDSINYEVYWQ